MIAWRLWAQVDDAIEKANEIGSMTVAGLLALALILSWGYFLWHLSRKDKVIAELAGQQRALGEETRTDLKQQIADERENTQRVEAGLQQAAASNERVATKLEDVDRRLEALERQRE